MRSFWRVGETYLVTMPDEHARGVVVEKDGRLSIVGDGKGTQARLSGGLAIKLGELLIEVGERLVVQEMREAGIGK